MVESSNGKNRKIDDKKIGINQLSWESGDIEGINKIASGNELSESNNNQNLTEENNKNISSTPTFLDDLDEIDSIENRNDSGIIGKSLLGSDNENLEKSLSSLKSEHAGISGNNEIGNDMIDKNEGVQQVAKDMLTSENPNIRSDKEIGNYKVQADKTEFNQKSSAAITENDIGHSIPITNLSRKNEQLNENYETKGDIGCNYAYDRLEENEVKHTSFDNDNLVSDEPSKDEEAVSRTEPLEKATDTLSKKQDYDISLDEIEAYLKKLGTNDIGRQLSSTPSMDLGQLSQSPQNMVDQQSVRNDTESKISDGSKHFPGNHFMSDTRKENKNISTTTEEPDLNDTDSDLTLDEVAGKFKNFFKMAVSNLKGSRNFLDRMEDISKDLYKKQSTSSEIGNPLFEKEPSLFDDIYNQDETVDTDKLYPFKKEKKESSDSISFNTPISKQSEDLNHTPNEQLGDILSFPPKQENENDLDASYPEKIDEFRSIHGVSKDSVTKNAEETFLRQAKELVPEYQYGEESTHVGKSNKDLNNRSVEIEDVKQELDDIDTEKTVKENIDESSTKHELLLLKQELDSLANTVSSLESIPHEFEQLQEELESTIGSEINVVNTKTEGLESHLIALLNTLDEFNKESKDTKESVDILKTEIKQSAKSFSLFEERLQETSEQNNVIINELTEQVSKIDHIDELHDTTYNLKKSQENTKQSLEMIGDSISMILDDLSEVHNSNNEMKLGFKEDINKLQEEMNNFIEHVNNELKNSENKRNNRPSFEQNVYLDHIDKNSYNMKLCMEWLEFLLCLVGRNNMTDILSYYVEMGWISDEVRLELLRYSDGIDYFADGATWKLTPDDHIRSIWFIERLAGVKVDKNVLTLIDREVANIKKGVRLYNSI
ncbi:FlaD/FlaE family flagellar protein [Methanosalsum natronophilum]|uniref:FlaD/FlaE family flagellar protein n=1 Tax=Methanosalsum natronophilum TaxID=768733 RepID=UPI002169C969|nr:FlaD/FlaE family flagellar protein [Methanosalsum natronophilum]MCS3924575.1 archaellum component FlaD/FlaE [Methanosalsum natronophilum]